MQTQRNCQRSVQNDFPHDV